MWRPARQARDLWRLLRDTLAAEASLVLPRWTRDQLRTDLPPEGAPTPDDIAWARARAWDAHVALRRWRAEPRDGDALAEGVSALDDAVRAARLSPDDARGLVRGVSHALRFGAEDARTVLAGELHVLAGLHPPAAPTPAQPAATSTADPTAPAPPVPGAQLPRHAPPAARVRPVGELPVAGSPLIPRAAVSTTLSEATPLPPAPARAAGLAPPSVRRAGAAPQAPKDGRPMHG